jgi:DNA-binding NarL/FixJ family response regulator
VRSVIASGPVRVLIVEDNFFTRLGAVTFLRSQPKIDLVAETGQPALALHLYTTLKPDVVVMDVRMRGLDGARVAAALFASCPDARVLALTRSQGDEDMSLALDAGARGCVTKEASGEELVAAIRTLHAGHRYFPPERLAAMPGRQAGTTLTRREQEVLCLVADGASNREISDRLRISERTVAVHVGSILRKFGARSRTEAVSLALKRVVVVAQQA